MWRNAEYGIHTNAFVCYACIVRLSWCGSNLFLLSMDGSAYKDKEGLEEDLAGATKEG